MVWSPMANTSCIACNLYSRRGNCLLAKQHQDELEHLVIVWKIQTFLTIPEFLFDAMALAITSILGRALQCSIRLGSAEPANLEWSKHLYYVAIHGIQDPKISELIPLSLEDFHHFEISKTCELAAFVKTKLGVYKKKYAYFQFTCVTDDVGNHKEVLLMDKVL